MGTIILGGGIIGLSTAYYLSLHQPPSNPSNPPIHIIDSASSLFLSASGCAGGFLALDWFAPPAASLGRLSYKLHRELARQYNGQTLWGYAGSHTYSLSINDPNVQKNGKKTRGEDWLLAGTSRASLAPRSYAHPIQPNEGDPTDGLNADGTPRVFTPQANAIVETVASHNECAQVEPRELCSFLLSECRSRGVQVHLSTDAVGVVTSPSGNLTGIALSSPSGAETPSHLPCQHLILSAGCWTPMLFRTLFPSSPVTIPIKSLAGHHIIVKSPRYKTPYYSPSNATLASGNKEQLCYSIYCAPSPVSGSWTFAPEAYARLARNGDTEVWVGGLNDWDVPLPQKADETEALVDPKSIDELRQTTVQLFGLANAADGARNGDLNEDDLQTLHEGMCFRPVSDSGVPIVTKMTDTDLGGVKASGECGPGTPGGVYIASGHGPWGISLSLGTGYVVAEMVLGKKTSADIGGLGLTIKSKL